MVAAAALHEQHTERNIEDSAVRGQTHFQAAGKQSLSTRSSRRGLGESGGLPAPHLHHATASRVVKGEDVLCVQPLAISSIPQCFAYMVCDGHCGVEAAEFVSSHFLSTLSSKLPSSLPDFRNHSEVEAFAESTRKALCETFVRIDNEWAGMGHFSGTTVTVALVTGWLLTVANTGDSAAVLDTGLSMLELIKSHRIAGNLEEQARLKQAGLYMAPLGFHLQGPAKPGEQGVGPLRLWPGGLCVSRSVGDLDAGAEVVPVPHIRQVLLPRNGSRVIMASDGLWDVLNYTKALKLTRSKPTGAAASALINAVSRDMRSPDDATIIVIDLLPNENTSFPTVALKSGTSAAEGQGPQVAAAKPKKSGGFFSCFKPPPEEPDSREIPVGSEGHVTFLHDVDCLLAYPGLKHLLTRTALAEQGLIVPTPKGPGDFTLHGGSIYTSGASMKRAVSHAHLPHAMSLDNTTHSAQSDGLRDGLFRQLQLQESSPSQLQSVHTSPP